jgi:hypothetical protein
MLKIIERYSLGCTVDVPFVVDIEISDEGQAAIEYDTGRDESTAWRDC